MFDITSLMPHGMCFNWRLELLLAHSISDGLIALAYLSIPLAILYLTRRKPALKMGGIYTTFVVFILACGMNHVFDLITIWYPHYYLQAVSKMVTALVSVYAAYRIWTLVPSILAIPSIAEYEAKNKALKEEIVARKATEDHLRQQRHLTEQLENVINEFALVSVTDTAGNIIYANDKFCEVSGYELNELIGNNHRIVNSGYHEAGFFRNMWQSISSGHTWHDEIRNVKKDGSYYWVDAVIQPLCDEVGKPYRYVSIRRDITEEVKARETLTKDKENAEELVTKILDNLPAYASIKDINGRIIYANPMTCKLFEKTLHELMGVEYELFNKETAVWLKEDEINVLREGVAVTKEEMLYTQNSSDPRYVMVAKVPLFKSDGSIKGLLLIGNDVTEEKQSKHRVEELARFNQSVLDSLNAKVCVLDAHGTIIAVNRAWLVGEGGGYTPSIGVGANYIAFCDKASVEDQMAHRVVRELHDIFEGRQEHFSLEYPLHVTVPNTSGENQNLTFWYLLDATRFPGEPLRVVVSHTNITERRQLDHQLRDKETLLATILNNIGAYVYMKSPELRYLYANPQYARLYGRTPDEMTGLFDRDIASDTVAEEYEKMDRLVFDTGENVEGIETVQFANMPEARYLWSIKLPLRHEDGRITALLGISTDITDKKLLDDEKVRLMEKSARVKTEFLANISHEIRTPMNSVLGVTELLRDTPLDSEQAHYLDILQFSCQHVLCLINDMLELSKIEAGHWTMEKRPFKLSEMLGAVLKSLIPLAQNKGLNLIQKISDQIPDHYQGSALRLGQIITNLVGNAIKFTSTGSITVTIEKAENQESATEADQIVIHFAVADTGIGIPVEHQERIFKAFEQVGRGGDFHTEGTGLGLTISSSLVYLMGGHLKVESTVGKGSVFFFELPLQMDEPVCNGHGIAQSRNISLEGKRILLVEDNEINRELVEARLNKLGCLIRTAEQGQNALDILQDERFDLILMDMRMPIMDGPTATRLFRLRESELGLVRTPIIALTANAHEEDVKTCIESGMDAHIGKPFTVEMLLEGISRVYEAGNQQASSRTMDTVTPVTTTNVFDVAAALEMSAGDRVLLDTIEGKFIERFPELLSSMRSALSQNAAEMGRDAAHTLKGNAGYLCANELKQYAALIESLFREGQFDKAWHTLSQLEQAAERLMKAIKEHRQEYR